MKVRNLIFLFSALATLASEAADVRYVGGDISLLPTYKNAKVVYKDLKGNTVDFLEYSAEVGMNAMRVRLFVDPAGYNKKYPSQADANVCQDLDYIIPLCQDIVDNGFKLMLDFHYSDTWADPVKQWIPEAWKNMNDDQLVAQIYDYTKNVLETLKENGVEPAFIQTGNEISYGMLWTSYDNNKDTSNKCYINSTTGWPRFGRLLESAISACREVCPKAQIVLHTERIAKQDILTNFYTQMKNLGIDYDIIGLSYYPYYHGTLANLESALNKLEKQEPDKKIMIVEAGYPLYWKFDNAEYDLEFGYGTADKQNQFTQALVDKLLQHENVNGIFWWWMEYNPYISSSSSLSGWYNSAVIDPYTGKPTPAFATLASFGTELEDDPEIEIPEEGGTTGVNTVIDASEDVWYDLQGNRIKSPAFSGVYIHNGKKVMVRK